jgi:predicted metal-dependent hydrolase
MTFSNELGGSDIDSVRLAHAVDLFNRQDWYDAHDAFEDLWHESIRETRVILQGIIQIAVAEHHLCNGNLRGSLLLMAEGLNRLQASSSQMLGLDLGRLTDVVSARLSALQAGQPTQGLSVPKLLRTVPDEV